MPQQPDFRDRIAKLQAVLTRAGVKAAVMEGGAAMMYFTGVRWGRSERTFAVVVPAKGGAAFITPGFEEMRARELIKVADDVRVWQEHESPFQRIAEALRDRGVETGKVAIDDAMRFFIFDGLRKANGKLELVSGGSLFTESGMPARMEMPRRTE